MPYDPIEFEPNQIAARLREVAELRARITVLEEVNTGLLAACEAAQKAMTNKRYNAPRLDMESEWEMCDRAIQKSRGQS